MADSFPQIKHVVLLSLENRSFDHMLGGLPGVNGALAGWTNSDGQRDYPQTPLEHWEDPQVRSVDPDPMHETRNVLAQLENANRGFVADYATKYPGTSTEQRQKIMSYYPEGVLYPLHTLAKTFAVCDRWHASVPGPTWTNRLFTLSGTARGRVVMPSPLDYDQPSLFRRLFEAGRSSRVYYGDVPLALLLSDQRVGVPEIEYDPSHSYYPLFLLKYLFSHSEKNFPDFVFIEPAYTTGPNDDHPPHDPIRGQRLIAEVYNELRANDALWKTTLFVILYDEHGGFADHVPPPPDAVPPDDYNVDGFPFNPAFSFWAVNRSGHNHSAPAKHAGFWGASRVAEGIIQWVTQNLARFASRSILNFASSSAAPPSRPTRGCCSRASWTSVSA